MTLEDLRVSLNNIMGGHWVDIERAANGEIVIHTRLVENAAGELVPIDDAQ